MIQTHDRTQRIDPLGPLAISPPRDRASVAPLSARDSSYPPLTSLVGRTPLVPLVRVIGTLPPTVALYAKLEGLNPGGSVKDRAALSIVREAMRTSALAPGKTLIDATSGNTGIAYAMLGAALGFPVQLTLPANASPERVQILRAYGAQLTLTDPAAGIDGARHLVQELVAAEPDRYFHADQYSNPANPLAHYTTTGPEIWQQTEGKITHFVAGLGTSGTMMGTGRYLRERSPTVQLIGVQPDSAQHGIAGLKHLATAEVPAIYNPGLVDRIVEVNTEEAQAMARWLARQEGLFVGISAGAAVVAALRVARKLARGVVVALLPDGGFKYASASFWAK
ncbi:MAG: PLP-dependent cysteine synthase family protein [Anaerolineae bacterium]